MRRPKADPAVSSVEDLPAAPALPAPTMLCPVECSGNQPFFSPLWRALGLLRAGLNTTLDVLLPQLCAACGSWIEGTRRFCPACAAQLDRLRALPYCPRCGRTAQPVTMNAEGCGFCRREVVWNLHGIVRVGPYTNVLRPPVLKLKYHGRRDSANLLGGLLAEAILAAGWSADIDLLVPVPMHWRRRLVRRCRHADLLAYEVSRRLRKIPVCRAVRRVRHSISQMRLHSRQKRLENVKGCFAPAPRAVRHIKGRTVCIVDNICVSGGTLTEVAKALRRAGARRIYAAIVARSASSGDMQGRIIPAV